MAKQLSFDCASDMHPLEALFLTAGSCYSPSSRYRSFQFFPYLRQHGITPYALPLYHTTDYLRLERLNGPGFRRVARALYLLYNQIRRVAQLAKAKKFDLTVIEHEIFAWTPFRVENTINRILLGRPCILDYDDASYIKYSNIPYMKKKIPQVMAIADLVMVGSPVLRDFARQFNHNVELLPTVVDLNRYTRLAGFHNDRLVIGWIGGPQNARHLKLIAPALASLAKRFPILLRCMGAPGDFRLPGIRTQILPWSWAMEIDYLLSLDVGISPLDVDQFSQGKCAFKLLQYMACGLPVVASPVGANKDIVAHGIDGFLAGNDEEWQQFLERLYEDRALRVSMGEEGRKKAEKCFSVQAVLPQMVALYRGIVSQWLKK